MWFSCVCQVKGPFLSCQHGRLPSQCFLLAPALEVFVSSNALFGYSSSIAMAFSGITSYDRFVTGAWLQFKACWCDFVWGMDADKGVEWHIQGILITQVNDDRCIVRIFNSAWLWLPLPEVDTHAEHK